MDEVGEANRNSMAHDFFLLCAFFFMPDPEHGIFAVLWPSKKEAVPFGTASKNKTIEKNR